MTPKSTALFSYIVAVALLTLALGLLIVSSIPYSALKSQLEALTLYGNADVFTEGFHRRLVTLLRAAAVVPLVAAVVVFFFRRRIAQVAGEAGASLASFFLETATEAVCSLRKESRLHLLLLTAVLLLGPL